MKKIFYLITNALIVFFYSIYLAFEAFELEITTVVDVDAEKIETAFLFADYSNFMEILILILGFANLIMLLKPHEYEIKIHTVTLLSCLSLFGIFCFIFKIQVIGNMLQPLFIPYIFVFFAIIYRIFIKVKKLYL